MIKGCHAMFYSSEADALREFLRDKLGLPATDVGEGWLIFDLPEADLGCHPADDTGKEGEPSGTAHISFYCDDLDASMTEMKERGVEFVGEPQDVGWSRMINFKVPGDFQVMLYEPRYKK